MKISLQWLRDYVPISLSPGKVAHKLTMAGLEVEKTHKVGGDMVFELEITPNRSDCLNMIGMAREVSAILDKKLSLPKIKKVSVADKKVDISIQDKKDCGRYIGTVIAGVHVSSSPEEMKKKLAAIGKRPINNIVDITNFCLMETGQPLHAFDLDKLEGRKIIVRRACKGEKILTLDGVERQLDPSVLVIADAKKPVAIAGIMGGANSEVSSSTQHVLLESAYFDPILIRKTARRLGLSSDSSYRFERDVDIQMVEKGSWRAVGLITEICGGKTIANKDLFVSRKKTQSPNISLSWEYLNSFLGAKVPLARCRTILKKLEFNVSVNKSGMLKVSPPSFRKDVKDKEDVVEEIARVIGYDNLPLSVPHVQALNITPDVRKEQKDLLRGKMVAQGMDEIITYTMIDRNALQKTRMENLRGIPIRNPLTQDQEMMSPALLPRFLSVVLSNFNRGQKDFRLFETAKVYSSAGEKEVLGMMLTGSMPMDWRRQDRRQVNFYDLKGIVQSLAEQNKISYKKAQAPFFDKAQNAEIFLGSRPAGFIGKVTQAVLDAWGIKEKDVFYAQVDITTLFAGRKPLRKFVPLSEYPASVRDISIAVKGEISFAEIQKLIQEQKAEFLRSVTLVEQYLGEKIPDGHRGLTLSFTYQSASRTLRDEEVSGSHEKICQALIDRLGAIQR